MSKGTGRDRLKSRMAYLNGTPYRIEDYPWEAMDNHELGPAAFRKGVAYHYHKETAIGDTTLITDWLLPFRGVADENFCHTTAKIGIWFKRLSHDRYQEVLVLPRDKKEVEEYSPAKEKDIIAATLNHEFQVDQFSDSSLFQSDIGTGIYAPPMHIDDDPLNMLIKQGIRLKKAPFEPYAQRLRSLAVDKKKGVEGANIVNNTRRGFRLNRALSPTKALQFSDVWQMEPAFILRDVPGSMHPMDIPRGKMLVIYPDGIPFKIEQENLIDIRDMVDDSIATTAREEDRPTKRKSKKAAEDDDDGEIDGKYDDTEEDEDE